MVSVQQVEDPFLFAGPGCVSLDHWVQVIVPALTALLADSSRQVVGNLGPLLGTVEVDEVQEEPVLDVGPGTFD